MTDRVVQAPAALLGQSIEPLTDWAFEVIAGHGHAVTGEPVRTRRRAWSLVVRIPTTAGPMWAKANARAFAHEGHLLALLARLCPGSALEPVAVQPDRGWLLSRHGGDVAPDTAAEWTGLVRAYAGLQQSLTAHIDELRGTGTPYLPPARLVTVYQHYEPRIPGLGDRIAEAAAELGDYRRLSIEHNDVHPGNAFAGTGLLFDWADAVITHPLLSHKILRTPHRDEYLAHWRRGGPISRTEIALAERLAPLIALHPWRTIDVSAPPFARTVEALLDELRTSFR